MACRTIALQTTALQTIGCSTVVLGGMARRKIHQLPDFEKIRATSLNHRATNHSYRRAVIMPFAARLLEKQPIPNSIRFVADEQALEI